MEFLQEVDREAHKGGDEGEEHLSQQQQLQQHRRHKRGSCGVSRGATLVQRCSLEWMSMARF